MMYICPTPKSRFEFQTVRVYALSSKPIINSEVKEFAQTSVGISWPSVTFNQIHHTLTEGLIFYIITVANKIATKNQRLKTVAIFEEHFFLLFTLYQICVFKSIFLSLVVRERLEMSYLFFQLLKATSRVEPIKIEE